MNQRGKKSMRKMKNRQASKLTEHGLVQKSKQLKRSENVLIEKRQKSRSALLMKNHVGMLENTSKSETNSKHGQTKPRKKHNSINDEKVTKKIRSTPKMKLRKSKRQRSTSKKAKKQHTLNQESSKLSTNYAA